MCMMASQVRTWFRDETAHRKGFVDFINFETDNSVPGCPIYYVEVEYIKDEESFTLRLSVHEDSLIMGTLCSAHGTEDLDEGAINRDTVQRIVDDFLNCVED